MNIPPSFLQRLKKNNDDSKFKKFLEKLSHLLVNISFLKALKEMPGYDQFMRDLVIKKRVMNFETIKVTHNCIIIITSQMVVKKENPSVVTIPCTIGVYKFEKVLCDLGKNINWFHWPCIIS